MQGLKLSNLDSRIESKNRVGFSPFLLHHTLLLLNRSPYRRRADARQEFCKCECTFAETHANANDISE